MFASARPFDGAQDERGRAVGWESGFPYLGTRMTEGMGWVVIYCFMVDTICTRAHKARRHSPMAGEW